MPGMLNAMICLLLKFWGLSWLVREGVPLLGWGVWVSRLGGVRRQRLDREKTGVAKLSGTSFTTCA